MAEANDLSSGVRFLNRELSALDFSARVLSLAEDGFIPLLERVKFLAIFADNLDDFFQVRVAGLKQQVAVGVTSQSPDGMTPKEQLEHIAEKARSLASRHAELFLEDVMPALSKAGIELLRYEDLDATRSGELDDLFLTRIFPIITPLAVDPGHPFPYISNLSSNLAVIVSDPRTGSTHFARVKVPPLLPRFLELGEEGVFVPVEDVIAANLDHLFPGMHVVEHHAFRVTRNTDLEVDDGAEDLMEAVEKELRRLRFSPAVRLEVEPSMPSAVLDLLTRELQLTSQDVYRLPEPLDLTSLWEFYDLDRDDLKDPQFKPVPRPELKLHAERPGNWFSILDDRDVLVHHPYDSFSSSVQKFIDDAAADPDVLAIKQTVYRTSGESRIVDALIEAAKSGKQVVVLVEIKARFDEVANINWARRLERAGCNVVYGVVGLKTHSKLCLVIRRQEGRLARYAHIGTGNYNAKTALVYEDMGLLTSDPELTTDVGDLFNFLTGYSRHTDYKSLLVAPLSMREKVVGLIQKTAAMSADAEPGRVVMKVNALADPAIIDALYAASSSGAQIDLIVRGICALRPGVPQLSDNIHVRSILGRFLEHARVMHFKAGDWEEVYVGSADMMHRNLDRRVEAFARIKSEDIKRQIASVLELALTDNTSAWVLAADGRWQRLTPGEATPIEHQEQLMNRAASGN